MKKLFLILSLFLYIGAASASVTYQSPSAGAKFHYNDQITFEFEVQGSGGTVELYRDGVLVQSWNHCDGGCSYVYSNSYTPGSGAVGDHTWSVEYIGSTDGSDASPAARDYTVANDAQLTTITHNGPSDGATFSSTNTVTYDFNVEENSDSSGSVEIVADTCSNTGQTIYSDTTSPQASTRFTYDKTFDCYGTFSWYVFYTGNDGSTTYTSSDSFTIESDASQLSEFNIDSPSDGTTFNGDVNQEADVTLDVNIGGGNNGQVEFYIDGSKVATKTPSCSSCSTSVSTTQTLNDGVYDWHAKFVGEDGSTATTSTYSFEIDDYEDRASVSVTSPNDGATVTSESVTFDYSGSGPDGVVELYVDGSKVDSFSVSSSSGSSSHTMTLSNGDHNFYAKYVGDDGSSTTTATKTVTVDAPTEAEETSLTHQSPNDGATITSQPVSFEVQKSGMDGSLELYIDNSLNHTWTLSCSSCTETLTHTVSGLTDGGHNWYVKYIGTDGSTKETLSDSFTMDVPTDAEQTTLRLDNPVDSASFNGETTVEFQYTVSGEPGTVELYSDTCTGSNQKIASENYDGTTSFGFYNTHTFDCSGTFDWYIKYIGDDGSTNTSSTRSFAVDIDADSFGVEYLNPTDGSTTKNKDVNFKFNASGDPGTVELFVDGASRRSWSAAAGEQKYTYLVSGLSTGTHNWYVKYTGQDNSTATGATKSFDIIESTGPAISFQSSTATGTQIENWVLVNVSVTDSNGVKEVIEQFNGVNSSFTTNKGNYYWTNHTGLSTGTYSFKVYANDTNGNTASSGTRTVTVEYNQAVSITISDPDNLTYAKSDIPVDISTSDPNSHDYTCDVRSNASSIGSLSEASESFKSTLSRPNGFYNVSVTCSDEYSLSSNQSVYFSVNQTEDSDGGSDGSGSGGSGGGSSPTTIIRNVTSENYKWSLSAATSKDQSSFTIISRPGGSFRKKIEVANEGENPVHLSLNCVSSGDECSWVSLSNTSVNLSKGEAQVVTVKGSIPSTVESGQVPKFSVQVTDPDGGRASVDFYITINSWLGGFISYLQRLTVPSKVVPALLLALFSAVLLTGGQRLFEVGEKPTVNAATAFAMFWILLGIV